MNAVDLLHNMVRQYAALDSYRDTGYVTRISLTNGGVNRLLFSTLYQQPSLFRFTFFRRHPYPPLAHNLTEHTAGFDGTEGYVLKKGPRDFRAVKQVTGLNSAIAGATGISSGSAHTIGRLLLGGERELWIEKDTLLLRKVIGLNELARTDEVRESILVNEPLESRLFAA